MMTISLKLVSDIKLQIWKLRECQVGLMPKNDPDISFQTREKSKIKENNPEGTQLKKHLIYRGTKIGIAFNISETLQTRRGLRDLADVRD